MSTPSSISAIFVWIDGIFISKIFGKIPRIFIDSGKDFAEDFSIWMGFLLVKITSFESFFYGIL